jgi:adenylosuccinate lyase
LAKLLSQDPQITRLIPQEETLELLDAGDYVGEAPLRTRMIFAQLKQRL